jgi:hypothetical protein
MVFLLLSYLANIGIYFAIPRRRQISAAFINASIVVAAPEIASTSGVWFRSIPRMTPSAYLACLYPYYARQQHF